MRTPATMDSATILLNPSLLIARLSGADVQSYEERSQGGNKEIVVRFRPGIPASASVQFELEYAGAPAFGTDSINGLSARWIELGLDSYWHPVFADYAQLIVAHVRFELPPGWQVAASGEVTINGHSTDLRSTIPLIDVALSASPSMSFRANDGVRPPARVYFSGVEPPGVDSVLATITSCGEYLNARYGRAGDSLPPIRMVIAPRGGPGYARKNYIVITTAADMTPLAIRRFACHELAHYWSSGAIANGPENWLNEAFAEFVAGRFIRSVGGDSAHASIRKKWEQGASNAGPVWTPMGTRRPSARASYNKAPLLLDRLEQRVGTEMMERILVRYMTKRIRTTPQLLAMIAEVAGGETAKWLEEELAK